MSASDASRMRALESRVRQQQAKIDRLLRENDMLREDLTVAKLQLQEERIQHRETRNHLMQLRQAIDHLSDQHKALLRRTFEGTSERLLGTQELLPACLDELDPDLRSDFQELEALREQTQAIMNEHEDAPENPENPETAETTNADAITPDVLEQDKTPKKRKRPAQSGGRKPLPEDFPRQEEWYTPPSDHPYLAQVVAMKEIDRRIIERIALVPIKPVIKEISCLRVRLEYRNGTTSIQTLAPPAIMGTGQADDSVLIHSACDKILDHLPSYRQSQRFERIGFPVARSKLCRWHIALAHFLEPCAEAILHEVVNEPVIGIDDTIHRLLDAELHRCKKGRLWAITGTKNVFYFFSETREGQWIDDLLAGYGGGVMGDAYAGHNVLLSRAHVQTLYCWAHVRRKFFESTDDLKRKQALYLIGRLYDIERNLIGKPPDQKVASRTQQAQPILAQFKQLLNAWQADKKVLPKSSIGRATTYALNQWDGLITYLTIGEAPIDNNRTERAMRPNALHRKNSLFSASVKGAESYATLSTIIHSACQYDLNPTEYLTDIIEELHFHRRTPAELTPACYSRRKMTEKPVKHPC